MTYIVEFRADATQESIDTWLTDNTISFEKLTSTVNIYKVVSATVPPIDGLAIEVHEDQNISAQLLGVVEILPASTGETTSFDHDSDWWKTACSNVVDFNADSSTFQKRGKKTNVYLVDSGVKVDHPDLVNATVQRLFAFNDDHTDVSGHGTALSSLVVGTTLGISDSTLKAVKIFDPNTATMVSDIVRALDAILIDMLANPGAVAIVNMSWSIPKNTYVETRIQGLIDTGAFVVAAAGNSGVAIANVTPASMEAVLTVGAYTDEFKPADFSNYSSDISNTQQATNSGALDCWSPGTNIKVASIDGTMGSASGTSVAAAIMTACLAYNSDFLYSNDGFTAQYLDHLRAFSLFRTNMLNLSDARYKTSINVISTFFMDMPVGVDTGNYSMTRIAYDNTEIHGFIAYGSYTTKIELDNDLPSGLSLSNGWLVGKLDTAPESTTTLSYLVTLTFASGATNTFPLTLHLAKAGTAPNDTPVDITLLTCSGATCGACVNPCWSCGPKNGGCICAAQNAC